MRINKIYNLVIIGGGAAGIMAAISAKREHPEFSVAILDRTFALGRKILVCGAGRCNLTNINLDKSIEDHYYGATSEFISSVFDQFGFQDIIKFFADLGIEVYTERKTDIGKIFPVTDQAKTVTSLLEDELERLGVEIHLNTDVTEIHKNDSEMFEISANKLTQDGKVESGVSFESEFLIISAGGKTYPALGSNGSGYNLIESLGHKLVTPVPSALPVVSKNRLSQELQGVKMEIEVTSLINGVEIKTRSDDVMFTQYGLSGPAILNISREISIHINRENKSGVQISLNFFPGQSQNDVKEYLVERWSKRPSQTLEKSLFGIFPNKIATSILKVLGYDVNRKVEDLRDNEKDFLATKLTNYIVDVQGTRGWNEAEFTAGGINTSEVKNGTLESNLVENLYFCGEILDVDGDVGGFNLSWAWSSGNTAGKLKK